MRIASPKQDSVVRLLQEKLVLSLPQMMQACECSRMTVFQALKKAGYYSSFNFNAAFYALAETAKFDAQGLWGFEGKRFSRYRSLTKTLAEFVRRSEEGCVPPQLERVLGVSCRLLLGRLAQQGHLHREKEGRGYVYFAPGEAERAAQKEARARSRPTTPEPVRSLLPPGMEARPVVRTLALAVADPKASPRQLARRLRGEGLSMTAQKVRRVFSYYGLAEKRGF